jgi:hypothetical protein
VSSPVELPAAAGNFQLWRSGHINVFNQTEVMGGDQATAPPATPRSRISQLFHRRVTAV